jgi:predicted dehydrogenase
MKKTMLNRRDFIHRSAIAGAGLTLAGNSLLPGVKNGPAGVIRIGIIGLDTSHCTACTKAFNDPNPDPDFAGFKVVAAFPTAGSSDLPASINRLAGFTEQVRKMGVEIVNSIDELLKKVDVVLLETVDGRKHLEQALPVFKARKLMFIDKPVAASLADTMAIFDAAKSNNVPVFSSSSLRYITGAEEIAKGKLGKIFGVDTFGPASIEKTHPDMFWYGIHGIEMLFGLMGTGCKSMVRVHTDDTDMLVGTWQDGRIGSYRGTRTGRGNFGGTVFGEKGNEALGEFKGYKPLWVKIVEFFKTGVVPVTPEETLEIVAFMEAADESKSRNGIPVEIQSIMDKARKSRK